MVEKLTNILSIATLSSRFALSGSLTLPSGFNHKYNATAHHQNQHSTWRRRRFTLGTPLQPRPKTISKTHYGPNNLPLFTVLPLELQLMIWNYVVGDACASYLPHLTPMTIIADFVHYLEPEYKYSYRSLLQTWTAPQSGTKIYWLNCWYRRNPLRKLLNSCCMARLVVLKWTKTGARWNIYPRKVTRFNMVVGEMSEDLEKRV